MVEWVIIIAIVMIVPVVWVAIKLSWNMAGGGIDLMQILGNAGKAGTTRQLSNDEINANKKKKHKGAAKWSKDGKLK